MEYLPYIAIAAAFAIGIFLLIRARNNKREAGKWRNGTDSRVQALLYTAPELTTADGIPIYFEDGLDPAQFPSEAVDRGKRACYARADCEYTLPAGLKPVVCVLTGIPDSNGDPCFKVYIPPSSPYYNSEWDKEKGKGEKVDHYVLAAGQITRIGEPDGEVIAIPYHNLSQAAHCQTICDFELEHGVLAWVDPPRYEATKIHGNGQGHPIIPGTCIPTARGIMSAQRVKCEGDLMLTR